MAYIGKTPLVGNYQKCDALTASATADYTLQVGSTNVVPESVNHMIVSLNGVIQAPTTAYTVSGATLSFASALTSNDTIDFVLLLGNVLDIGTPSDDTVATAKIVADAVTEAKIADDAVESEHLNDNVISGQTALGAVPADTDELLISDAGTIKRVDYSYLKSTNTPAFFINKASSSNQDISTDTATKITFDSEVWDEGSGFDLANDKFVVPAGEDGKYHINFTCRTYDAGGELYSVRQQIYKNGSRVSNNEFYGGADGEFEMEGTTFTHIVELNLSASDYLECYMTCKTHDSSDITILGDSNFKTYFTGFKLII